MLKSLPPSVYQPMTWPRACHVAFAAAVTCWAVCSIRVAVVAVCAPTLAVLSWATTSRRCRGIGATAMAVVAITSVGVWCLDLGPVRPTPKLEATPPPSSGSLPALNGAACVAHLTDGYWSAADAWTWSTRVQGCGFVPVRESATVPKPWPPSAKSLLFIGDSVRYHCYPVGVFVIGPGGSRLSHPSAGSWSRCGHGHGCSFCYRGGLVRKGSMLATSFVTWSKKLWKRIPTTPCARSTVKPQAAAHLQATLSMVIGVCSNSASAVCMNRLPDPVM